MHSILVKKIRRITVVIFTLLVCFIFIPVAFAHPLGNFTINQYVGLKVSSEIVLVDYVLDMAEIPAFQEIALFDTNGNGQADSLEFAAYPAVKCASLQPDLNLLLDKKALALSLTSSSVEFPTGVGGLPTLRLTCGFQSALDLNEGNHDLAFANNAFPERIGWKEIVVHAEGTSLQGDYSATSLSDRLTNYPQDLLTSPLDQRAVELKLSSVALPEQNGSQAPAFASQPSLADRNDAFTRLILMDEVTLPALLIALAISFVWGAMHALTPGHGKTIVGAYLVGSRGTPKHALYLGLTTTITHTLGVFALGLITLFAAQFILPEKLYPWMSLISGLFVIGIGASLVVRRYKASGIANPLRKFKPPFSKPAPTILSIQPVVEHVHADGTLHNHSHILQTSHSHPHPHAQDHSHAHGHDHHDHSEHSHLPPGADGAPVTGRSLLLLGVSGGIIPCPSALVVLLGAIALNRIGFGLVLVLAFSFGLAGALTAIGLMFIYAGRLFERVPAQGRIVRAIPVLSALLITLIGLAISLRALQEAGIFM
jgi:ABC-type nickel/cobalt efflux system permease component RcnA